MSLQKWLLASILALSMPAQAATEIDDVNQVGALYRVKVWTISHGTEAVMRATALYRSATLAVEQKKPFFLLYAGLLDAAYKQPLAADDYDRMPVPIGTTLFVLLLDAPQPNAHNAADVIADLRQVVADGYFPAAAP